MGGECASEHETQKLSETCQVETDGALGEFNVLPREISEPAGAGSEKSAEVVVGKGNEPVTDWRTHKAKGPKEHVKELKELRGVRSNQKPPGHLEGIGQAQLWNRSSHPEGTMIDSREEPCKIEQAGHTPQRQRVQNEG